MNKTTIFCLIGILRLMVASTIAADAPFHTRAIWVDPPSFASAAAADQTIARCQQAGLNLILPNVMCHQTILFKSTHFPGRVAANETFDPLAYLITKAHAAGLKVQPWSCVYYEGMRSQADGILHSNWSTISLTGQRFSQNFISPANPEVNPYLLTILKDLLNYDIDGIHLDYIRYPGGAFDYSAPARRAFAAAKGFDPQGFLDHPERIVEPRLERFPVRVLQPKAHAEKVWETTATERTLDQAGLGYAFVSEAPENIKKLRVPGLLIISSYYGIPTPMLEALADYVTRGGQILWADIPSSGSVTNPLLQRLTGVASSRWLGARKIALTPAPADSLGKNLSPKPFRTDAVYEVKPHEARVAATFDNGTPAILHRELGKGRVITLAFHLMKSTSPEVAAIAKDIAQWCQSEAGVSGPNPLVAKRADWFGWRAERVTDLVRDLSVAAKQKNPQVMISSSGGPAPSEFFACYRDAGRWLAEGINDQLFPMNYTPDPEVLGEILDLQTAAAPPGKVQYIYPGLQIYATQLVEGKKQTGPQKAEIVEQQLRLVRQHGYQGFCLFAANSLTDEIISVVRKFSDATK